MATYLDIISLAEAKLYLRVDDTLTEDDAQITNMINSSLQYVEDWTNIIMFSRAKTYRFVNSFVKVYDYPINSVTSPLANVYATGTAKCTSVIAGNTTTLNGLLYTASATPTDYTEFDISGDDTATAASLARSVNGDTRTGTLGDVSATSLTDTVTLTTNKKGFDGNATTLAETGGTITLSGATFTGGLDGDLSVEEKTLFTNYCFGTGNSNLILNVGYEDTNDNAPGLVQVAYEIIDLWYYEKQTGNGIETLSSLSMDTLNKAKRFIF